MLQANRGMFLPDQCCYLAEYGPHYWPQVAAVEEAGTRTRFLELGFGIGRRICPQVSENTDDQQKNSQIRVRQPESDLNPNSNWQNIHS